MPEIMPLRRAVVQITHQADEHDQEAIRKAVRKWHNALANGTIPRSLVKKFGRELYLRLDNWEAWVCEDEHKHNQPKGPGRPRSV
jgi:hypothetical protein